MVRLPSNRFMVVLVVLSLWSGRYLPIDSYLLGLRLTSPRALFSIQKRVSDFEVIPSLNVRSFCLRHQMESSLFQKVY